MRLCNRRRSAKSEVLVQSSSGFARRLKALQFVSLGMIGRSLDKVSVLMVVVAVVLAAKLLTIAVAALCSPVQI